MKLCCYLLVGTQLSPSTILALSITWIANRVRIQAASSACDYVIWETRRTGGSLCGESLKMAQLYARKVFVSLARSRPGIVALTSSRTLATEANPEDYGYYPDPLEAATGREKKMLLARLAGDDRYEPKVYYRAEVSSREKPNLVPSHFEERIIGCMCEPDSGHVNFMMIRKGPPKRCECGHWFKAIDADPESV
ncbi:Cytochrome c oxidase subunit 5B, mitochondrial [Toxocara canis]|uniref:Cytochrome c oxidase subunit 5B, mitochondrial n=1 Tax=Toxocara canis TaxID=6265 RepID=A0A0B2V249_TOXCA|nr:Cytochrome c oxidase subunit 5B, mitochondrial [Toxocara canis]